MASNFIRNIVEISKIKNEMMTKAFMILKEGNEGLKKRLSRLFQNMHRQNLNYLQFLAKSFNIITIVPEIENSNENLEIFLIFMDNLLHFDQQLAESFQEAMSDLVEPFCKEWQNQVLLCDFLQMSTEVLQEVVKETTEKINQLNTEIIHCLEQNKKIEEQTKANIQQLKINNSLFQNITYDLNKQNEMGEKLLLIQGKME